MSGRLHPRGGVGPHSSLFFLLPTAARGILRHATRTPPANSPTACGRRPLQPNEAARIANHQPLHSQWRLYEEVCELALEDCHVPAGATKRPRPVAHIIPSPPLDRL